MVSSKFNEIARLAVRKEAAGNFERTVFLNNTEIVHARMSLPAVHGLPVSRLYTLLQLSRPWIQALYLVSRIRTTVEVRSTRTSPRRLLLEMPRDRPETVRYYWSTSQQAVADSEQRGADEAVTSEANCACLNLRDKFNKTSSKNGNGHGKWVLGEIYCA